ncbi:MAG: hypothetical protein ACRDHW_02830 [Ktedonobacteraceae bacterium]
MGKDSIFCTVMAGGQRCHRPALLRCANCGLAVCTRHATRVSLFGGTRWVCLACRRKRFSLFSLAARQ